MSKIVLNDVTNLSSLSVINDNFDKIEQEFQSKVHYRDNPEGEPNTFENDVDLNGNSIYNVENLTVANTFTVNGKNVEEVVDDAIAGIEQNAAIASNSATAAAISAATAVSSATSSAASAATATTKASEASTSATNAGNSATAAASSATAAASSATAASGSATSAASSAATATTQASNASSSASAATTSATNAANSATSSTSSATASANSASSSAVSATAAATSASEAAASAASVNDVNLVHKAGVETITGVKTFTQPVYAPMIVTNSSMGFRNRIINGDMRIWQRGTTLNGITPSLGAPAYTADRWFVSQLISQSATDVTQQTGGATKFSIRVQKRSGSSGASANQLGQVIENLNCLDLPGKPLTLSFTAKVGANYSATSNALSITIYTCTTANQSASSFINGTAAGQATLYSGSVTLTASTQTFTITTSAVASNATNVCIVFAEASSAAAAGANDWFELSDIQLEAGTVATPFERRDYGRELMMCQRYYETGYFAMYSYGANAEIFGGTSYFAATKRAVSTITFSGIGNVNNSGLSLNTNTVGSFFAHATGTATTRQGLSYSWAANAEL